MGPYPQQRFQFQPGFQRFSNNGKPTYLKPEYKHHVVQKMPSQSTQKQFTEKTTKIDRIALLEMIADSIKLAREQKLRDIPYNFNFESFSFSTESPPEEGQPQPQ